MKKLLLFTLMVYCLTNLVAQELNDKFLDFDWGSDIDKIKLILAEKGIKAYTEFDEGIAYFTYYTNHVRMISLFTLKNKLSAGSILYKEFDDDLITVYESVVAKLIKYHGQPIKIIEDYYSPYEKGRPFDGTAITEGKVKIQSNWLIDNKIMIVCHITSNLEINVIYYTAAYLQPIEK